MCFQLDWKLGADVSVVLDHPFLPTSDHEERKLRWSNTVKNTRSMFKELQHRNGDLPDNFQLMPVLHGYDRDTLERSLADILQIWGREPDIVGIGSLAPLARNGNKRTAIDVIVTVRQLLPKRSHSLFLIRFGAVDVVRLLLRCQFG